MSQTAQIINFESRMVIEVPSDTLVATSVEVSAMHRINEINRQIKVLNKQKDADIALVQAAMGERKNKELLKTILVDEKGLELATWKQNKDSIYVDEDKLLRDYPEVYNQVAELKEGSWAFRPSK